MKKYIFPIIILVFFFPLSAQLKPGTTAPSFDLQSTTGERVKLEDYKDQKGVILVFTNNTCPFAIAYESRIALLHKRYEPQGFPVIAINPVDIEYSPDDCLERMIEKNFPYPYLKDKTQEVCKAYGASRTPQLFLLSNRNGVFTIVYTGSLDDNPLKMVTQKYLEQALIAVYTGRKPDPEVTRAVGCKIKIK